MRIVTLLLTVLAFIACNRGIDNKDAVRQGVLDYLSTRTNLNVASMKVDVMSVVFRNNEADAVVTFAAKGASPGQSMEMRYTLEKKSNRWVVKTRADSGKSPHGAGMGAPSGAPGTPAVPGELPPGHPSLPGSPGKNPKSK